MVGCHAQDLIAAEQDEMEEIDITEAEERDLQLFMPAQKSARRYEQYSCNF